MLESGSNSMEEDQCVIANMEGLLMQCAKGARLDGRFGKIGCVYGDIFFCDFACLFVLAIPLRDGCQ